MNFAMEDGSSEQKHDEDYRASLSTRCRKKRGTKRKSNFRPPVNKQLKSEMEEIKTDSTLLEKGLRTNNSNNQEDILQEPETAKHISDKKIVSHNAKNNGEQDDKNSENSETIKSCPLNLISDNIVKSLDSIFFPEDANDNMSFSNLRNDLKSQQKQHVSPSSKKNAFHLLEENTANTYNLLEKEIRDELTMLNGLAEKEEHFLLSKTAISAVSERNEQNKLADNGENSMFTKFPTITLDNKNKKEDENNITETTNIYLTKQEKCVNLECHADVKDFVDNENKLNTTIRHANLDDAEILKKECIHMQKNTEFQVTESVKETSDKVSLFQLNSSPALIDELLNGIKRADTIVNMLSKGSDTHNCTANGDITNIQYLKNIPITSLNKNNEKRNLQENCNEDGNGLANCTDCKNECDQSSFNGVKSPKHDPNNVVENDEDKVEESGSNVFQEENKQMNSMDKSLVPHEKKLTLFYINALDYDKEILANDGDDLQTNIETKGDAQFLNDSMNIETNSFERKRLENIGINMEDINENTLNESDSLAISSTNTDKHLTRDKDELETSENNYFQIQNLFNTNSENVIMKKTINELIHDQDCNKSVCNDQNERGSGENITHCDSTDKENKSNVSCDIQQSEEVLTTETAYIIKEIPSTVSLAENSNSSDCKYNKISHGDNATEEKLEKTDDCIERKCLKIPEMSLLVTATDYFKVEKVENTEFSSETENIRGIESRDSACVIPDQSHDKENIKEKDTTFLDTEDSFDMDDDFDLTASQLSLIDVDERNHIKILKQEKKNSSEETAKCVNTHFNSDSVTVDIMDQLCYIRESVESIKELLSMLLKEK